MKYRFIFVLFLFLLNTVFAQTLLKPTDLLERERLRNAEIERARKMAKPPVTVDESVDAIYYKLDLNIGLNPDTYSGVATEKFIILENNKNSIKLDFDSYLNVNSVGKNAIDYTLSGYDLTLTLDNSYNTGDTVEVMINYSGIPRSNGFYAGFWFGYHGSTYNNTRAPVIFTLSEPYGARTWWPCKDDPRDKPDSMDIIVTIPDEEYHGFPLYAVSNGTLVNLTDNGNGTRTFHWHEQYPITTYLVSLAISNYQTYSEWYVNAVGDSMPVDYFVYPERIDDTTYNYTSTVDMIRTYSERFIEYPFIEEKYGMANFSWGGAMEHQTVSSMGTMNFWVVAHELAHQWFGDLVTCADFRHIWLNEGWATYCEALYAEELGGKSALRAYMNDIAYYGGGTIFCEDPLTQPIFTRIVYDKAGWVNHMLRGVMGDSLFFEAVRSYLHNPDYSYKAATTEQFQAVMEQYYDNSLQWFFQQWIYGSGYPQYQYTWETEYKNGKHHTDLTIHQSQQSVFTMPIDVSIMTIPGPVRDTLTVFNDQRTQTFQFVTDDKPASFQIDPEDWILCTTEYVANIDEDGITPFTFELYQNYPNPFNSSTIIKFQLPETSNVTLKVYDTQGRQVAELLNEKRNFGTYTVRWNADGFSSGVYYIQIVSDTRTASRKCMLIK